MEMVRKVADAMHDRLVGEISYATCEMLAKAAIEAMRAELLVHLSRYAANDPERYGMQSAIDALNAALSPSGEK